MTDEHLSKLSNEIDAFLIQKATDNETPALALSAIILARLLHLNNYANSTDDFKLLLTTVSEAPIIKTTPPLH